MWNKRFSTLYDAVNKSSIEKYIYIKTTVILGLQVMIQIIFNKSYFSYN